MFGPLDLWKFKAQWHTTCFEFSTWKSFGPQTVVTVVTVGGGISAFQTCQGEKCPVCWWGTRSPKFKNLWRTCSWKSWCNFHFYIFPSVFVFLVSGEELVINTLPRWQETQMILNAMNVGTSISQWVSGQTVSRDSLGIALNLYRRSLTFVVLWCVVPIRRAQHCDSVRRRGCVDQAQRQSAPFKEELMAPCSARICRLLFALPASGCLLRRKKRTEMAQALITTLSVQISAQICDWFLECFISHVSHVSPLLLHHGEAVTLWHRICAAILQPQVRSWRNKPAVPSHPVAASSLSKMWERIFFSSHLRTSVNFHFWAKISKDKSKLPDGVRVWARSYQVRLLDAGT